MTVDIFKRRTAGDPINGMPADLFNSLQEMLRWYLRVRSRANAREGALQLDVELSIKNDSGGPLDQYAVVRTAGDPVIYPRDADTSYYGDVAVKSLAPIAGQSFAILQRPSIDGEIVPAICDGLTLCRLKVNDASHGYAECVTDEYGHLESRSNSGPARIVWLGEDDSTQLNGAINSAVTTFTVDDLTDLIENVPFVIIIGDEEINVLEVDDDGVTILDCERGYNSTTAASHADNATVTLTGGIVWALVSLERSVGSYHFAVSLTTITEASGTTLGNGLAELYSAAGGVMTATGDTVAVLNPCAEIAANWKLHLHRDPESGELLAYPLCEFVEGSGTGVCDICDLPDTVCVGFDGTDYTLTRIADCVWELLVSDTLSLQFYWDGTKWAFRRYDTSVAYIGVWTAASWDCTSVLELSVFITPGGAYPSTVSVYQGTCGGSGESHGCGEATELTDGVMTEVAVDADETIWLKFGTIEAVHASIRTNVTAGANVSVFAYVGTCDALTQVYMNDGVAADVCMPLYPYTETGFAYVKITGITGTSTVEVTPYGDSNDCTGAGLTCADAIEFAQGSPYDGPTTSTSVKWLKYDGTTGVGVSFAWSILSPAPSVSGTEVEIYSGSCAGLTLEYTLTDGDACQVIYPASDGFLYLKIIGAGSTVITVDAGTGC